MRSPLHRIFRKIVFWAGDTRRLSKFPWVTWAAIEHKIGLDEVWREAFPKLREGDIILHRDEGFLSNLFIGGFMIHAGIYVGDGYVVEAISEGVKKRSAAYILYSDYAMILRPKFKNIEEMSSAIREAMYWAELAVNCEYDELFDFDIEHEREALRKGQKKNVKLACTETPLLCYYDYMDQLGIYRRRNINMLTRVLGWLGLNVGEEVIDADMFVRGNFDIVWKNRELDKKTAYRFGCDEGYLRKIEGAPKCSKS
jgi:hypothetical protein